MRLVRNIGLALIPIALAASAAAQCQTQKLLASDGSFSNWFGFSQAVDGNSLVVGAVFQDDLGPSAGAAYVYDRTAAGWVETVKLSPADQGSGDRFGHEVGITGDTILVSSYLDNDKGSASGAMYAFERIGGVWTEVQKFHASDETPGDFFGFAFLVEGDRAIVSGYAHGDLGARSGKAYVFEKVGGIWTEVDSVLASDGQAGDFFGFDVGLSGDTFVLGALMDDDNGTNAGAAYVFEKQGTQWVETAKLLASDGFDGDAFGFSVDLDGSTIVVGAQADDDAGNASGSAYVFEKQGSAWVQTAKLVASDAAANDLFGIDVSIDGDLVVVGANGAETLGPDSGAAYLFDRVGSAWVERGKLVPDDGDGGDALGVSSYIEGDDILVGANKTTDLGVESGSLYTFSASAIGCPTMTTGEHTVSLDKGGTQALSVSAGAPLAGQPYIALGSLTGTFPGTPLGGFLLPLNADAYTNVLLQNPGLPPLGGGFGTLDVNGDATVTFTLAPTADDTLDGLRAHHAVVVFDPFTGAITHTTNAIELSIGDPLIGMPPMPEPTGNPVDPDKASLGKTLFWDEQLSSTRTVACGTCHIMSHGGDDPRSDPSLTGNLHPGNDGVFGNDDDAFGSPGVPRSLADGTYDLDLVFALSPQVTPRNGKTVINSGYGTSVFWDGRATETFIDPLTGTTLIQTGAALESQALFPLLSTVEMGHVGRQWSDVTSRIQTSNPLALASNIPSDLASWIAGRSYPALFQEIFGDSAITPDRIALALATYERSLISDRTDIDSYLLGQGTALNPQELIGFNVFQSANCNACHTLPLFEDLQFHYTGVRPQSEEPGLMGVTGQIGDEGKVRTPSLRNVALRGPYFHDGSAATLSDVIDFYDRGGDFSGPNKDTLIQPLGLTPGIKAALLAFLTNSLTDRRVQNELFPFDRPTLYSESGSVPTPSGIGTVGSLGETPHMVALEPPQIGNPNMTVGVDRGLGGALAYLGTDLVPSPPGGTAWLGATIFLGLSAALNTYPVTLGGSGGGQGFASFVLSVPAQPSLAGTSVFGQWIVLDPGAVQGVAASEAARWTLFQ